MNTLYIDVFSISSLTIFFHLTAFMFTKDAFEFVNQQTVGRLWDANTGKLVAALEGHTEAIRSATFSPDGQRIATAAADDSARVWDAKTGNVLRVLKHSDNVYTVRFSPDGTRVVTASKDGTARVWSIGTR